MEIFSNEINHLGYILKLFESQKCIKSKHLQPGLHVKLQNPVPTGVAPKRAGSEERPISGLRRRSAQGRTAVGP
jgi:hypothetical protein